jgi:hypothetical protein
MKQTIWSYGGGVQSVTIACLVAAGRLPRPDRVVIADTGREAETTWAYLDAHVRPLLAPLAVEIAPHSLSSVDLYSPKGTLLIPAFTSKEGKTGMLPGYCSVEWKRRVVRRWLRNEGVKKASLWLGISVDEVGRAKPSDVKWLTHEYPLIDLGIRRKDCYGIIEEAGLPPAPKSSCWMCPYRGAPEWAALTPGDLQKAKDFELDIQSRDPNVHLRRDLQPVGSVNPPPTKDLPLFGAVEHCDSGFCWV